MKPFSVMHMCNLIVKATSEQDMWEVRKSAIHQGGEIIWLDIRAKLSSGSTIDYRGTPLKAVYWIEDEIGFCTEENYQQCYAMMNDWERKIARMRMEW